ncbi:hypothetical protein QE357_002336 [Siphonobacter sp. BAB-5404]|nr:hypothetical protein [Siphonobacter sp. SORGH_AS_1065]MDR6195284.1 hypothetical protein [Siphonobacter sp. SORGH_AS_0500]
MKFLDRLLYPDDTISDFHIDLRIISINNPMKTLIKIR